MQGSNCAVMVTWSAADQSEAFLGYWVSSRNIHYSPTLGQCKSEHWCNIYPTL